MAVKQKKRRWPDDEKRSICFQTTAAGVSVAQVARRYAMNANLIFKWLKDDRYAPAVDVVPEADGPVFLPVGIEASASVDPAVTSTPSGRIEIELSNGHRITKARFCQSETSSRTASVTKRTFVGLDPMAPFTHWCTVPFRDGGRMPIGFRATGIDVLTPQSRKLPVIDRPQALRFVLKVLIAYGGLSPGSMVDVTHAKNGPRDFIVGKSRHSVVPGMRIPGALPRHRSLRI